MTPKIGFHDQVWDLPEPMCTNIDTIFNPVILPIDPLLTHYCHKKVTILNQFMSLLTQYQIWRIPMLTRYWHYFAPTRYGKSQCQHINDTFPQFVSLLAQWRIHRVLTHYCPGGGLNKPTYRDQQSWVFLNDPKNTLPLTENLKKYFPKSKALKDTLNNTIYFA